jgi:hypothetical protein
MGGGPEPGPKRKRRALRRASVASLVGARRAAVAGEGLGRLSHGLNLFRGLDLF